MSTPDPWKRLYIKYFNILHKSRNCLALALFVTAIFTDDAHNTLATYNLAVSTYTLD
jgi:hypothetical protein